MKFPSWLVIALKLNKRKPWPKDEPPLVLPTEPLPEPPQFGVPFEFAPGVLVDADGVVLEQKAKKTAKAGKSHKKNPLRRSPASRKGSVGTQG